MTKELLFGGLQQKISDEVPGALEIFNDHMLNHAGDLVATINQQEPSKERQFKSWFSEEVPQQGLFWWQG